MIESDISVLDGVRLSNALLVALTLRGAVIPRYGDQSEILLDLPGLLLIEAISASASSAALVDEIASRTGAPTEALTDLLRALAERRLLVATATQAPATGSRAVDETAVGVPEEASLSGLTGAVPDQLVLPSPVLVRCRGGRFEAADHQGTVRASLTAVELSALLRFQVGCRPDQAYESHCDDAGPLAADRTAFDRVVQRGVAAQLLLAFDPTHLAGDRQAHQADAMRDSIRRRARVHAAFDQLEADAGDPGADGRVPVFGVHTNWTSAPASLGMILAYARAFDDGGLAKAYDFRPRLAFDTDRLVAAAQRPGVFLFSNYIWSSDENLGLSARAKQANPFSITIHGGPNTPKFAPDVTRFFAENPHVDIAVHGEGEATFAHLLAALRGQIGNGPADLSPLRDVPGLSYRDGDQVVTTDKRDRVEDLDTIPSPILAGLYDGFVPAGPEGGVAIETNRGCPYGCTFCDWGSATLSRVRKFDLDRIFAELEWCARNQIQTVGICDANFGIFERDVEIAERIAELKAEYGFPRFIGNNYAKNTVKHLSKIIDIFTQAGIVAEGKMSMQSFDAGTLTVIRRKNIKVEKYDELAVEFRRNRLPLSVDLMLGLPGSTPSTFRDDLQACVDRDVRVLIQPTMLLPNSPMNEPAYREEHGIVAQPGEYVEEAASFTHAEWQQMHRLGSGVWLFENFGILRQVATYVRAETAIREVDFYDRLIRDAEQDPERWPSIRMSIEVLPHAMVPPVSWRFFLDDVRRHVVEVEGVLDDEALDTALTVQHALLPARDRHFPQQVELPHDYVAWRRALLEARDHGHRHDWPTTVRRLREFGPGVLPVDDPYDICTSALDGSLSALVHESSWDFESPVSRPRQRSGPMEQDEQDELDRTDALARSSRTG